MTDFDTCACLDRPIKCPACCLASWEGHQCDGMTGCDLTTTAAHRDGHETTNDQRSA